MRWCEHRERLVLKEVVRLTCEGYVQACLSSFLRPWPIPDLYETPCIAPRAFQHAGPLTLIDVALPCLLRESWTQADVDMTIINMLKGAYCKQ